MTGQFEADALVDLGDKTVVAPAVAADAEEQIHQRTQGHQVVAEDKILEIENCRADAHRMDARKKREAEGAGQREQNHHRGVDHAGLLDRAAGEIGGVSDDVLQHGDHRRHGREGHEKKEQRAPEPAVGHVVKHVGEGDENQGRPGGGFHVVGKAGRKDDNPGQDGHQRVEPRDGHCFAGQALVLADVGAKDGHGADADAQRKKGLAHGGKDGFGDAGPSHMGEVRFEIKGESLAGTGQEKRIDGQHDHKQNQSDHHHLDDAFDPALEPAAADGKAGGDGEDHEGHANRRVAGGGGEDRRDPLGAQT